MTGAKNIIPQSTLDALWIKFTRYLAKISLNQGEIPIGAVLIVNSIPFSYGINTSIQDNDPSSHAEVNALRNAAFKLKNYRINTGTLYVNLEPCVMCIGMILNSRIKTLVFSALSQKTGAVVSNFDILNICNHKLNVRYNIDSNASIKEIQNFFKSKRKSNKSR